ncbi:MAG TPA: tRNA (adenosine(37)-N6)-threonylcarbamoyltransferase complex ATPase subunit type 1 TsaE [Burkholderiaceae bacterium]|nr:tRNA (adenosine(37)-N6)-threonylcarbamoyltransferase complex ATPase subunit type 1 TsaE [Burkholderiaceae bacterium]
MQATFASRSTLRVVLPDEEATARLGAALAQALLATREAIERQGLLIGLCGELGSGKTALVRAALRRLGVTGTVRSPTFSLLELYTVSRLNFYHFDFYRFSKPEDFSNSGFRDFFAPGSVCAMEWPERAGGAVFTIDLRIGMQIADSGRIATFDALTQVGQDCLQEVTQAWQASQDGAC